MSYNKTNTIGNLTSDPEMRYTPSGKGICQFCLALNSRWTDKATGEKREEVSFINFVAFAKTGETIAQYFKKGDQIHIEGRLHQDTWEDKQTGAKRSAIKVHVDSFTFLNGNKRSGDSTGSPSVSGSRNQENTNEKIDRRDVPQRRHDEDDVPF